MKKDCSVCKKQGASYKCSKCREPYCSVSCCKRHKESCNALNCVTIKDGDECKEITSKDANESVDIDPMDCVAVLHPAQLAALDKNHEIQSLIKSSRLTSHIHQVDSANDRQETLKRMRENIPEFEEFACKMLKVVKCANTQSTGLSGVLPDHGSTRRSIEKREIQQLLEEAKAEAADTDSEYVVGGNESAEESNQSD